MSRQLLDAVPVPVAVVLFLLAAFAAYEVGFRVGRWWQRRTPEESEGPTAIAVGSLLTLMAFLLAITTGMANERFDARRALVVDEANAIGTAYLRAGYLPAPADEQIRDLLREYVPLRLNLINSAGLEASLERSHQIQQGLWAIAEDQARTQPDSEMVALFIISLNEVIDLDTTRVTAILYARVPETLIWLLLTGTMLALAMVGYRAGLSGGRGIVGAVGLVLVIGAVLAFVVDLDRPRDGFLQVSQQPLIDLLNSIAPPKSGPTT